MTRMPAVSLLCAALWSSATLARGLDGAQEPSGGTPPKFPAHIELITVDDRGRGCEREPGGRVDARRLHPEGRRSDPGAPGLRGHRRPVASECANPRAGGVVASTAAHWDR